MKSPFSILLFIAVFASACSTWHSGQMSQINTQPNPGQWVGKTAAQEKTTYLFFIGGNKKDQIVSSLQNQLMLRYKDSAHLSLQNFILNTRQQHFLFFSQVHYSLIADLYKQKQDAPAPKLEPYYRHNDLKMKELVIPQERLPKSIQQNGPLEYNVNNQVFILWNPPGRKKLKLDTLNFVPNAMIPATLIELNPEYVKAVYMNPQTYKVEIKKLQYNQIYQDKPFSISVKGNQVNRFQEMNVLQLFGTNRVSQNKGTLLFYNSEQIILQVNRPEGKRFLEVPLLWLN